MKGNEIKIIDKHGRATIMTIDEFRRSRGAVSLTADVTDIKTAIFAHGKRRDAYEPQGDGVNATFTDRRRPKYKIRGRRDEEAAAALLRDSDDDAVTTKEVV